MEIRFELVDGAQFATSASAILEDAWTAPGIRYTPEYVRWQLAFPALGPLPSIAAFDGSAPVGFAGITSRRLRHGNRRWHAGILSFVAVRPGWRNRGVAAGLYRELLAAVRNSGADILTGIPSSGGDRTLRRAYPEAGFAMRELGTYVNYGFLARGAAPPSEWTAEVAPDLRPLAGIIDRCARNTGMIWSDPDEAQWRHYFADPRPRQAVLIYRGEETAGAAWVVRGELRSPSGSARVTTVDNLWMPQPDPAALPALLLFAAGLWSEPDGKPAIVSAPNLAGFETTAFRAMGLRETGGRFYGYICTPGSECAPGAVASNMEIV